MFEPLFNVGEIPKKLTTGLYVNGAKVLVVVVVGGAVVDVVDVVVVEVAGARVVVVVGGKGTQPNSFCISFNDNETGGFTQALIVTVNILLDGLSSL